MIGKVDRLENRVTATLGATTRELAADAPIFYGEVLTSHEAARLEATLIDDTKITLGENAILNIDEFVYTPGTQGGSLTMRVLEGTFLFVGGKVEAPTGGNVQISTPFATLGIRGTTVWGGPLDDAFAVLVIDGTVDVTNAGKTVTLTKGLGTTITNGANLQKRAIIGTDAEEAQDDFALAPQDPVVWGQARIDKAFASVAFEE